MLPARLLLFLFALWIAPPSLAIPFATTESQDYLLVGRVDSGVAEAVNVGSSNSLGRIFTVPSSSDPDVDDNPPWPLPTGAMAPVEGITNDGNVAITHANGSYAFSDIDVHADIGIRCVQNVLTSCRDTWSGSTLQGGGSFADDAAGMAALETELTAAALAISGLAGTNGWSLSGDGTKNGSGEWDLSGEGGVVDTNTTITLAAGLNVIVIETGGNDFSLNNAGIVIGGPAGSTVVFLMADQSQNFLFSNASVTKGQGGIDSNSILFAMLDGGNDSNFDFSKVIVNGVAFWDLSLDGGEIGMDNVQGCTQLVGDKISLQDVQLSRCSAVPEPGSRAQLGAALALLLGLSLAGRLGR